jgi:hypothetical protein
MGLFNFDIFINKKNKLLYRIDTKDENTLFAQCVTNGSVIHKPNCNPKEEINRDFEIWDKGNK